MTHITYKHTRKTNIIKIDLFHKKLIICASAIEPENTIVLRRTVGRDKRRFSSTSRNTTVSRRDCRIRT